MYILVNQIIIKENELSNHPFWVFAILLFCVSLIGYMRIFYSARFNNHIKSFLVPRLANQLMREEYSLTHPVSIFLSLNFFLMVSLIALLWMNRLRATEYFSLSFTSLLLLFVFVVGIYFIKIIFLKLIGYFLNKPQETDDYIFTIFLLNQGVGIILLPMLVLICYGSAHLQTIFFVISFVLLGFFFLYRISRGGMQALNFGTPVFYIFMYLCALEILPLLIGIKLLEMIA